MGIEIFNRRHAGHALLEYWHDCAADRCAADECIDCGTYSTECAAQPVNCYTVKGLNGHEDYLTAANAMDAVREYRAMNPDAGAVLVRKSVYREWTRDVSHLTLKELGAK
jgi:hypothetical protein